MFGWNPLFFTNPLCGAVTATEEDTSPSVPASGSVLNFDMSYKTSGLEFTLSFTQADENTLNMKCKINANGAAAQYFPDTASSSHTVSSSNDPVIVVFPSKDGVNRRDCNALGSGTVQGYLLASVDSHSQLYFLPTFFFLFSLFKA